MYSVSRVELGDYVDYYSSLDSNEKGVFDRFLRNARSMGVNSADAASLTYTLHRQGRERRDSFYVSSYEKNDYPRAV